MQENIHHDDDQEDRFDECLDDVLDGSIEERLHAHHRLQFEPCGQAGPNLVRHLVDIPDVSLAFEPAVCMIMNVAPG